MAQSSVHSTHRTSFMSKNGSNRIAEFERSCASTFQSFLKSAPGSQRFLAKTPAPASRFSDEKR